MSIAIEFSGQLEAALDALAHDEWAVVHLRERVVKGADPAIAFASVTDFLSLARAQVDPYAFASCCWAARALAELSNTTERPNGLTEAIGEALTASRPLGVEAEVQKVADWYRMQT